MLRVVFLLLLIMQGKLSYNVKRTLVTITQTETSTKPSNITKDLITVINSTVSVTFSTKSFSSPISNNSRTTRKENQRKRSGQTKLYQKTVKNKNVRKSIIPFTEAPLSILYLKKKSEPHVKKSITKANQEVATTVKEWKQTMQANTKPAKAINTKSRQKSTSPRSNKPSFVYNSQIYEPIHEEDSELETYKDPYYTEEIVPLRLTSDTFGNKRITYLSSKYGSDPDNPVFGDQAFFSFILNDYFDRNIEDEPKLMEDVRWGKDFDKELTAKRDAKRVRRLENYYTQSTTETTKPDTTESKYIMEAEQIIKSLTAKPIKKVTDNHKEFKTIVDMFASKFGSYSKSNETFFLRKRDHKNRNETMFEEKDELQEAGELLLALVANYNNENKVDENENENVLTTLSEFEQFLNAHETQSESKREDYKDPSNALSRLRHVAKNVALVNNADYVDTLENMLYKK